MTSNHSYYFPANLSGLQKEFIELLLLLHRETLLLQLPKEDQEWTEERQEMNSFELFNINAQLATQNPYLLLHHYIPKKFLLMESKELFLFGSGKFQAFQKFIDAFELQRQPIDIIVVASSHKELDLIEGFIIGHRVVYKRYTGTPLHNNSDALNKAKKESEKMAKVNKEEDYSSQSSRTAIERSTGKQQQQLSYPVTLHLMSTSRLYRGFDKSVFPRLKVILSFDAMLREDQQCVESLRNAKEEVIPLVKFVTLYSMDHVFLAEPQKRPVEATNIFLANRNVDLPSWPSVDGKSIGRWLNDEESWFYPDSLPSLRNPLDLAEFPSAISTAVSTCHLARSRLSDLHLEKLDFFNYNANLRRLIDCWSQQMTENIDSLSEKLSRRRSEESVSQAEIEESNVRIAECFKKIQALNVEAANEEKKLERLDSQFAAQKETEKNLSAILSPQVCPEEVSALEEELELLKQDNARVSQINEQLRGQYQAASSLAADCSMRVKRVSADCEQLQKQLDGPALKLKRLVDTGVKIGLENNLSKLRADTSFMETYSLRVSKMVKDKQSSYVSPYVGTRSGRASRASTPKTR